MSTELAEFNESMEMTGDDAGDIVTEDHSSMTGGAVTGKYTPRRVITGNTALYSKSIITYFIELPITQIGSNIKQILEKKVVKLYEGKCQEDGYIRPGSVKLISHSNAELRGANAKFTVIIECFICSPSEGTIINCVAKNITKAGIRAETDDEISPVVIFVARDHHFTSRYFSSIKEGQTIDISVLGKRFELNDTYISIIGKLIEPKYKQHGK
jgi:DNA-directed RNA polymerase subunit E'/Rpb7